MNYIPGITSYYQRLHQLLDLIRSCQVANISQSIFFYLSAVYAHFSSFGKKHIHSLCDTPTSCPTVAHYVSSMISSIF